MGSTFDSISLLVETTRLRRAIYYNGRSRRTKASSVTPGQIRDGVRCARRLVLSRTPLKVWLVDFAPDPPETHHSGPMRRNFLGSWRNSFTLSRNCVARPFRLSYISELLMTGLVLKLAMPCITDASPRFHALNSSSDATKGLCWKFSRGRRKFTSSLRN